jgi:hypothetical protein
VLAIRTGEEEPTDLYPDPGDEQDSVAFEPGDGSNIHLYWANAVTVTAVPSGSSPQRTAKFSDLSIGLYITDTRMAIACTKFDKGGGWKGWTPGSVIMAAGANAVSRALASRRRQNKTLVGQVRYEWLGMVEATDRSGFLSVNSLQVLLGDPSGANGVVILGLTLDKRTPATPLAEEIARRAAGYKAARAVGDEHRAALKTYAEKPTSQLLDSTVRYQLPASM